MKLINKLLFVFIAGLVTFFFARKAGSLQFENVSNQVVATFDLSYQKIKNQSVVFSAIVAGKKVEKRMILDTTGNVCSLTLPLTDRISDWKISGMNSTKLKFNGALFTTDETSEFVSQGDVLTKIDTNQITIHGKKSIDLQVENKLGWLTILVATLTISMSLLYLFLYRHNSKKLIYSLCVSIALSGSAYLGLSYMREPVDNINITLETNAHEKYPVELYYAQNLAFSGVQRVADSMSRVNPGKVTLEVPPGPYRVFRIDLPANSNLTFSGLTIKHWLGKIKLNAAEMHTAFGLNNDLEAIKISDSGLQIKTGHSDPYLILSDAELHQKIAVLQLKKADYPLWFAILFYLIFIPILQRTKRNEFAWFFGLFLVLPGISTVFKKDVDILTTENRPAFSRQQLRSSSVKDLPKNTTSYINDQFGGRESFTTTWNVMRILTFKQTNRNSPVVIGKNGWYFYVAEGVREMVENKRPISNDTLALMCSVLNERHDWLKLHDMDYYLVIPPLSHTLFKENLPSSLRLHYKESKLDQFLNYAKKHCRAKIIDLRKPLFEAKQKDKRAIYYRVDSHWNLLGAYYGYAYLMQQIHKDHPEIELPQPLSYYRWVNDKNNEGDLAKLLSMNNYLLRDELIPLPKKGYKAQMTTSIPYPSYQSIHAAITYEQTNDKLPKLCMNRDSYTNYLIPYMSEHFSRSVYLWTPLFNAEVFKEEHPDIVVSEMLERFIMDLSLPNPPIVQEELKKAGLR